MSFTPGKIGELVKVYFIQSKYQYAKSRTTGIIAAERVTEFISLFILCSLGILFLNHNIILFSLVFLFLLVILSFILSKKMMENVIKFASKWNFVRKKNEKIKQLFISTHELLVGKNLIIGLILSITAWIIEGFAFYLILSKFVFTENFIWINFTYFISIFVGSVSMLPGGIGTTEGSLTYLLVQKGIENNIAVFSTYVIRMATLWFSTLIGIGSLIVFLLTSKFRLSEILKNDD
jgi:uncharacterized protein (TIRG00374 family)